MSSFAFLRDTTRSIVVIRVNILQIETTLEIQLVRPTEVCGKVKSEKKSKSLLKHHC